MSTQLRVRPRAVSRPPVSFEARARSGIGTGRALDPATRADMERGFGQDLSAVRIHTGLAADRATAAVGAQAYALGDHIVAGRAHGGFEGASGRSLLSHELAHVVQQRGGGTSPGAAHEAAADGAARAIAAGRPAGPQPGAASGVQRVIEFRAPGPREANGMPRVPELIERLNGVANGLVFTLGEGGVLEVTENPYGTMTVFEQRIRTIIQSTDVIPMRMTTREGMMTEEVNVPGPFNTPVTVDSYRTGYVDIDDLLAADDLALQDELIHFLTERARTPNYARLMGTPIAESLLQRGHSAGFQAELAVLRDFFGDPGIRALDFEQRIFRSSRNDTIRLRTRNLGGAQRGTFAARFEVVIRGTNQRMTPEEYRDLLAREAAARAPAPAAAGAAAP